ncbi:hypothetical protein ACU21_00100 [Actinobaculum suis]|nr:hypothetical protein ACU20_00100 [Actinobaculum suis]OCA96328.1 hypothetical protein ACU21_00100 [Actinobaculum suis]
MREDFLAAERVSQGAGFLKGQGFSRDSVCFPRDSVSQGQCFRFPGIVLFPKFPKGWERGVIGRRSGFAAN